MNMLRPVEKFYHLLVGTKNFFYDKRLFKSVDLKIPVISIGNLSFGGVGKTPCIIFLAKELSSEYKINIVTKSYKASLTEPKKVNLELPEAARLFGDEACLIQSKLPNCSVWSGPQKSSTAAVSVINQPDLILIDDGFSHRKLKRNFDLVLVDATQGFNDYLRESVNSLKRAHAVLITKVNLASDSAVAEIEKKIISAAPHLFDNIFFSRVKTEINLDKSNPFFVFCGLGRPETFVQDLGRQGYNVIHNKFYADHFDYSENEQKNIFEEYLELKKKYKNLKLVTTEKDFIKLSDISLKNVLNVPEHRIELDEDQKEALLEKIRLSL